MDSTLQPTRGLAPAGCVTSTSSKTRIFATRPFVSSRSARRSRKPPAGSLRQAAVYHSFAESVRHDCSRGAWRALPQEGEARGRLSRMRAHGRQERLMAKVRLIPASLPLSAPVTPRIRHFAYKRNVGAGSNIAVPTPTHGRAEDTSTCTTPTARPCNIISIQETRCDLNFWAWK